MAKPPPSGPQGDSGPDANTESDSKPNAPDTDAATDDQEQPAPARKD